MSCPHTPSTPKSLNIRLEFIALKIMATDTTAFLALGAIGIVIALIWVLVSASYTAVILWLLTKAFKLKTGFKTAFITALVAGVINFLIRTGLQLTLGQALLKNLTNAPPSGEISGAILAQGALGMTLILLYWIIGFVIDSLAIKKFYKAETGKAFLVGFVLAIIAALVGFLMMLALGAVLVGIILAASAA